MKTTTDTETRMETETPFIDKSHEWMTPEKHGAIRLWARNARLAVEVGTWTGNTAVEIAKVIDPLNGMLYCVDDFCGDPNPIIRKRYFGEYEPAVVREQWFKRMGPYDRAILLEKRSVEAAKNPIFSKGGPSIDFMFIDGCHQFEYVLADLESWIPLVRKGGTIAGDDYWQENHGVQQAVNKYAAEHYFNGFKVIVGPACLWRIDPT